MVEPRGRLPSTLVQQVVAAGLPANLKALKGAAEARARRTESAPGFVGQLLQDEAVLLAQGGWEQEPPQPQSPPAAAAQVRPWSFLFSVFGGGSGARGVPSAFPGMYLGTSQVELPPLPPAPAEEPAPLLLSLSSLDGDIDPPTKVGSSRPCRPHRPTCMLTCPHPLLPPPGFRLGPFLPLVRAARRRHGSGPGGAPPSPRHRRGTAPPGRRVLPRRGLPRGRLGRAHRLRVVRRLLPERPAVTKGHPGERLGAGSVCPPSNPRLARCCRPKPTPLLSPGSVFRRATIACRQGTSASARSLPSSSPTCA